MNGKTEFMNVSIDQMQFFSFFPKEILEKLMLCAKIRKVEDGEFILRENEKGASFFLIKEGEIGILKDLAQVGVIRKGDVLGESSLNGDLRNASAKALGQAVVIEVSVPALSKKLSQAQFSFVKNAIFERTLDKLSKVNEVVSLSIKQRLEDEMAKEHMSRFIVYVLFLVFVYVFVIQTVTILKLNLLSSSLISIPILILFGIAMLLMMKKSGYPMRMYGFTLENWRSSLTESFLFTLPILVALVALKWLLIRHVTAFSSLTLFHISPALNNGAPPVSNGVAALLVIVYVLFVPLQEIIFRGAIQSSLQHFLVGKNKTLAAILVSNIPYCMIHFHLSLILVVLTYLLGSFWGWMYSRQKTLIGVCFAHFLTGLFAFFILGLQDILVF
jgi:CRP-like cAMP-binding protein/membrane protease YdiL (CAAX protease family)